MIINNIKLLLAQFKSQDRRALAKIITIIESDNIAHQEDIKYLLKNLAKPQQKTTRIAISGPPGVGKSTFINSLGQILLAQKHRVAILAIDPSSEFSMGSILGDKTRMTDLLKHPEVFIRPQPNRGTLGGVAASSPDVIYVLESFGFDFIIIETVGVGQSESMAKYLVDYFVLLLQPGAGDALQAMKKGIVENADFILVNKTDGEQRTLALQALNLLKSSFSGDPKPVILAISAQENLGVSEFLQKLLSLPQRRRDGVSKILKFCLEQKLISYLNHDEKLQEKIHRLAQSQEEPIGLSVELLVKELMAKVFIKHG